MQEILQAITTVGFPIVCVLLCFWYINKQTDKMETKKDTLAGELAKVITNNTVVMEKVNSKLDLILERIEKLENEKRN